MLTERQFTDAAERYLDMVYRIALNWFRNPADAEDALQEVFCKRLYRAPDFASPEQERRWLFQVAANQCRDEHRRRGRRDLPLDESLPAPAKEYLGLWEQVAALPEKHRAAIHLHYGEGYSVEETARILGATVSAVKMRLKAWKMALMWRRMG